MRCGDGIWHELARRDYGTWNRTLWCQYMTRTQYRSDWSVTKTMKVYSLRSHAKLDFFDSCVYNFIDGFSTGNLLWCILFFRSVLSSVWRVINVLMVILPPFLNIMSSSGFWHLLVCFSTIKVCKILIGDSWVTVDQGSMFLYLFWSFRNSSK